MVISMLTVRLVVLPCEMPESQHSLKLEPVDWHIFTRMFSTLTVYFVRMQVVPLHFSPFGKCLIYLGHRII